SLQSYPRAARVFSTFTALPGLSTLSLHDALPILRVLAMVVEDVDVVQAQPGQGLIERAQQVLPRAAVPEGAVPHAVPGLGGDHRSEEHTSELQSRFDLVCRLLLEKKKHTPPSAHL